MSQVAQNVAIGLILAAGLVAVVATTIVLVLERRRQPGEVETRTAEPPPSGGWRSTAPSSRSTAATG
jgi:hypothetical protein